MNAGASAPARVAIPRTAHSALVLGASRAGAQAAAYVTAVALAHVYGGEDYGRYAFAQSLAAIAVLAVDHGAQFQIVQLVSRAGTDSRALLSESWAWRLVVAAVLLLLAALAWAARPGDPARAALVACALLAACADGWQLLSYAIFRARGRVPREAAWTIGTAVVRTGAIAAGIALRWPIAAVIAGVAGAKMLVASICLRDGRRLAPFAWWTRPRARSPYARAVAPFAAFALAGVAYFQLGTIAVSLLRGNSEAAVYQSGFLLFQGALLAPDAIATAAYGPLSASHAAGRDAYRTRALRLVRALACVGVGGAVALWVGGPLVVHLLLPRSLHGAAAVARWLAPAFALRCVSYAYGTALHAGGGERPRTRNNVVTLVALVGAGAIGASRAGATGMAAALVVTEALLLFLEVLSTRALLAPVR